MKKIIALLLCACLLAGIGWAEGSAYTFDTNNYAITAYSGAEAELLIPSELEGCPVEAIYTGVFYDNDGIASLVLPETLIELGKSNIYHMDALNQVSLPETLVAVNSGNFSWCANLTQVRVPSKVSYIGEDCFQGCDNLKEVYFEGAAPAFGADCFTDLPRDVIVYVPDDQLQAYAEALPDGLDIRPSGANAVLTGEGFDMDYYGTMTLHFVPAE